MEKKKYTNYYIVIGAFAIDINKEGEITVVNRYTRKKIVLDKDFNVVFNNANNFSDYSSLKSFYNTNRVFIENRRRELLKND